MTHQTTVNNPLPIISTESRVIRILLVERLTLLREALLGLISHDAQCSVVADTGDYSQVVPLMEQNKPHLIVYHLHKGDDDMVNSMVWVNQKADHPPLLVLTPDSPESATNRAALHAGASGLIEMKESKEALFKAIRCLDAGELWIDRRTTALVVNELRQQRTSSANGAHPKDVLSPREKEIVGLVATGLSTEAIAEQLFISEKTVRNHLVSIYAKLDVSNRIQLALCASKMGIA